METSGSDVDSLTQDSRLSGVPRQSDAPTENRNSLDELAALGADMAGHLVSTGIGFAIAGPLGAFAANATGSAVAFTLRKLANEFRHRLIGPREAVRLDAMLAMTIKHINEEMAKGKQLRDDGFFEPSEGGRAPGEEALEGILLAAQREYEERKVPYYASLLASIGFHKELSAPRIHLLIRIGERLSYRQLCLLRLYTDSTLRRKIADNIYGSSQGLDATAEWEAYDVFVELLELYQLGLVGAEAKITSVFDLPPASLRTVKTGLILHDLMQLEKISPKDVDAILEVLDKLRPAPSVSRSIPPRFD